MQFLRFVEWLFCSRDWTFERVSRKVRTIDGQEISGFVMRRRGSGYRVEYRSCSREEEKEAAIYYATR